jgi:hypothetical protein
MKRRSTRKRGGRKALRAREAGRRRFSQSLPCGCCLEYGVTARGQDTCEECAQACPGPLACVQPHKITAESISFNFGNNVGG